MNYGNNHAGGYAGILLLLISSVILVLLYLYASPLKLVTHDGKTTTEATSDIQAAQKAKQQIESQNVETMRQL